MRDDDPIERRRARRRRQSVAPYIALAGLVALLVVTVGVSAVALRRRAVAPESPTAAPARSAPATPSQRETVVRGVVLAQTIDIDSFLNANDAVEQKVDWSASPVLCLTRPDQPDVWCYFPRNATGAVRDVSHLRRPSVTVAGTLREPRGPTWVLTDCRLVSVEPGPAR